MSALPTVSLISMYLFTVSREYYFQSSTTNGKAASAAAAARTKIPKEYGLVGTRIERLEHKP
jgi:hypothetical protein